MHVNSLTVEKLIWTDRVKNEVLDTVAEDRDIVHTIKIQKASWIGYILHGNSLMKQVTEGKIIQRKQVAGRQGRRHKQLLDDLKETSRCRKLREKALERTVWRIHFGGGYEAFVRQTACDDDDDDWSTRVHSYATLNLLRLNYRDHSNT